ncbi:MAG: hypothetical protein QGF09_12635 [Rhodospirillales bacterium]|nr:hypothetical protein [Rhodospirillales bacterium]
MADSAASETKTKSETKSETKSGSDSSTKKETAPKELSASATSISHFSSVRTPEYRSGWNNIFGTKKKKPRKAK